MYTSQEGGSSANTIVHKMLTSLERRNCYVIICCIIVVHQCIFNSIELYDGSTWISSQAALFKLLLKL